MNQGFSCSEDKEKKSSEGGRGDQGINLDQGERNQDSGSFEDLPEECTVRVDEDPTIIELPIEKKLMEEKSTSASDVWTTLSVDQKVRLLQRLISVIHERGNSCSNTYKTEMCDNYATYGFCPFIAKCLFAHGEKELRKRKFGPKYKTKMCKNYHCVPPLGYCQYGRKCRYVHEMDEMRVFVVEKLEVRQVPERMKEISDPMLRVVWLGIMRILSKIRLDKTMSHVNTLTPEKRLVLLQPEIAIRLIPRLRRLEVAKEMLQHLEDIVVPQLLMETNGPPEPPYHGPPVLGPVPVSQFQAPSPSYHHDHDHHQTPFIRQRNGFHEGQWMVRFQGRSEPPRMMNNQRRNFQRPQLPQFDPKWLGKFKGLPKLSPCSSSGPSQVSSTHFNQEYSPFPPRPCPMFSSVVTGPSSAMGRYMHRISPPSTKPPSIIIRGVQSTRNHHTSGIHAEPQDNNSRTSQARRNFGLMGIRGGRRVDGDNITRRVMDDIFDLSSSEPSQVIVKSIMMKKNF